MKQKITGLFCALALASCAPTEKDVIAELNQASTKIFTSVADCVSKQNYMADCESSYSSAYNQSGIPEYPKHSDCVATHSECDRVTETRNRYIMIGKVLMPQAYTVTFSKPDIVGWEALESDLTKSVLLYSGPRENTAIRKDGRVFGLTPGA